MQCVNHTDCPKDSHQMFLHWLNYAEYYKADVCNIDPFLVLVVHIGNKRNAKNLPCLIFIFKCMRIADSSMLHLGLTRDLLFTNDPTAETIKSINEMAEITMTDEEVKDTAMKIEDGIWETFLAHKTFLDIRKQWTDKKLAIAKQEEAMGWTIPPPPQPGASAHDEALRIATAARDFLSRGLPLFTGSAPDFNNLESTGQHELTDEMKGWKLAMDVAKQRDAEEMNRATQWNNYFPQGTSKAYLPTENNLSELEQLTMLTNRSEWKTGFIFDTASTSNAASTSTSQGCAPVRNPYAPVEKFVRESHPVNPFSNVAETTVKKTPQGTFIVKKRLTKAKEGANSEMVFSDAQKAEMQKYLDDSEKEISRVIKKTFEEVKKLSNSNPLVTETKIKEAWQREAEKAELRAKGLPIFTDAHLEYYLKKKDEYDNFLLILKKEVFLAKSLQMELKLKNKERDIKRAHPNDVDDDDSTMPPLQTIPLHHLPKPDPAPKPTKAKKHEPKKHHHKRHRKY